MRRVVALRIKFLQDMLEEDLEAGTVDVDVESSVLANVIAYYEWHTENSDASDSDKKAHDQVPALRSLYSRSQEAFP